MSLLSRFDKTVAYLRSVFDEPHVQGTKMSMARVLAAAAMVLLFKLVNAFIAFVFHKPEATGMAGVISGAITVVGGTVILGLVQRKKPDGSTQADDAETSVVSPATPPAPPQGPQI